MPCSPSARSAAVPLAVATLLLGGCGSSEEEQRQEAFCENVPDLLEDVTAELQGVTASPGQAPELVGDAVERLDAVDPPEGVADDWQALVEAWSGMRDLLGRVDLTDPSANTEFAEEAQELQADLVSTGSAVDEYREENC